MSIILLVTILAIVVAYALLHTCSSSRDGGNWSRLFLYFSVVSSLVCTFCTVNLDQ